MKVQMMKVEAIKPYDHNPRRNSEAVPLVAASIKEFGFRQPLVVDSYGVLIAGHTRLRAAQSLGMKEVPVHVASNLTPAQVKAYRLADNKVGEISEWDDEKLMQELLQLTEQDIDMTRFGFDDLDLEAMTEEMVKKDERYLEDFTVLPTPKPAWVLLAIPEDEGAILVKELRKKYPQAKIHATFEDHTGVMQP